MSTIDQQFVEYIVKTLASDPEKVTVERQIDERGVLLLLTVDPEDIGRVIGRRGATAQAIRTLLRALGTKNDARYNLKIVDTEGNRSLSDYAPIDAAPAAEATPAENSQSAEVSSETTPVEEPIAESEETSALAEKTRAELAEYDDLDI